jgi:hypothetical protein
MHKPIGVIAKQLKENAEKLGIFVEELCDVVLDHERRLQELEKQSKGG